MNQPINLKQAVAQGKLAEFMAQHPHNPVSLDLEKRFEQVLDSMAKAKPTDGETFPNQNPED